jgi:hypothetical protein
MRQRRKACAGYILDQVIVIGRDVSINVRERRCHIVSDNGVGNKRRAAGSRILEDATALCTSSGSRVRGYRRIIDVQRRR